MRDFFSTTKFKVLLAVLVMLAGMMAYAGANGRLTAAPQEILSVLAMPFQKLSSLFSGGVHDAVEKYAQLDSVIAENEELRKQNEELRSQLVEYDRMKAENEAFRSLHNIEETNPSYTYASGFVIGRDPLEQFGSFTIDKGTRDGVKQYDVVVSDNGYLVGHVIEADYASSKVVTILSPSVKASGVVSRTRDNGTLTGSAEQAQQGQCLFTRLPRDTLATSGDQIITTGLGGMYPPDILVGTIKELIPESSGKSTTAVVEPGAQVDRITHVFVITSYED